MLVGIISDSHDHMDRIRQAVRMLQEREITHVIHGGDFVAPFALWPLIDAGFHLYAVYGNNDGEIRGLRTQSEKIGGIQAGPYRFELAGKRFMVNHYPLSDEQLAQEKNRSDYFIYGHTHERELRRVGNLVVINPGELCGWLKGQASFAMLETETGACEFVEM